jgi:hypothetical protein
MKIKKKKRKRRSLLEERAQKEQEKQDKKREKEHLARMSTTWVDTLCDVCMTTGDSKWLWAGCDRCERWFHYRCVSAEERIVVDASLQPGASVQWLCNVCRQDE